MSEPHTDITWRLRNTRWQGSEWASLMFEAATEIERLRAAQLPPVGWGGDHLGIGAEECACEGENPKCPTCNGTGRVPVQR